MKKLLLVMLCVTAAWAASAVPTNRGYTTPTDIIGGSSFITDGGPFNVEARLDNGAANMTDDVCWPMDGSGNGLGCSSAGGLDTSGYALGPGEYYIDTVACYITDATGWVAGDTLVMEVQTRAATSVVTQHGNATMTQEACFTAAHDTCLLTYEDTFTLTEVETLQWRVTAASNDPGANNVTSGNCTLQFR